MFASSCLNKKVSAISLYFLLKLIFYSVGVIDYDMLYRNMVAILHCKIRSDLFSTGQGPDL